MRPVSPANVDELGTEMLLWDPIEENNWNWIEEIDLRPLELFSWLTVVEPGLGYWGQPHSMGRC
jgi:hypothetical protein